MAVAAVFPTLSSDADGSHLQPTQHRHVEATFSQPNAGMCEHMVSWAQTVTAGSHNPAEAAIAAAAPPASQAAAEHSAAGVDGS
eukprot:scaffold147417_cov21-Tisochrysis_lutea.AAC.1